MVVIELPRRQMMLTIRQICTLKVVIYAKISSRPCWITLIAECVVHLLSIVKISMVELLFSSYILDKLPAVASYA